ncbi:GNAT family N-acetyltransferase [Paenibacillus montanisoli]|uniref:GNAT family N-acetyltransferase n=1 Tax=Paenibacillus montanisoli TaxID=2081970 RepID=A0A328U2V6_9BACL|nr:GNAT family N-acetyltransferase [Paenibacillus montanisoli]RAP77128.1 GNAT family N-acetyltransferase [Paenibacillus montanisoli]
MSQKEFTISASPIADLRHLVDEYIVQLSSPIDSFLEDHILGSSFYIIRSHADDVGYFAIHNSQRLTQFYIRHAWRMHAQSLFARVIDEYAVKCLFVPTCDEGLVSLVIDQDYVIKKQAYFFQDSRLELAGGSDQNEFRLAAASDLPVIEQVCVDFIGDYAKRIERGEIFVYCKGSELLGIGVFEKSKLVEGLGSIGMFTNETYRRQGIGKAIIVALRGWCKEHGVNPVSGCWYYNEASKKTLESAGMVTKTRLLHVEVISGTADE